MRALARLVLRASAGVMALNGAAGAALCAGPGGAASGARPCVDAVHDVATTRWLKLQTLDYTDEAGKARKWDMASRTTKRAGTSDGVAILALLRSAGSSTVETLLVEQFRPPVGRRTLELPAGLVDAGETAEAAALRELKEETGYTGVPRAISTELCMSPGMTDESMRVVVVDVDLDAPANVNPAQMLDEGEYCTVRRMNSRVNGRLTRTARAQVRRVPLSALRDGLDASDAPMPFAGLYMLALGVQLGADLGTRAPPPA